MEIKLAHLYPDILNLSADKGNILAIRQRCEKRGISFLTKTYGIDDEIDFENTNIILIGGGCEKDKITVSKKLMEMKEKIDKYIADGGLIIAVASSYPIIGKEFEAEGEIHKGLSLVDMTTTYDRKRKTGNVVLKSHTLNHTIVAFENHNDKTTFGEGVMPLGEVIYGANKGQMEGVITENIVATHLHGPILPKNPLLTDYIIAQALKNNGESSELTHIDSHFEENAHNYILKTLKIS